MIQNSGKEIRLGVIGAGFGGHIHVPAFRSVPGCEVVSIFSARPDKAREAAGKLGIPQHYEDWRELITKSEVDAVSIAVPPRIQPEIALFALSEGKHVFCEKPLATDASRASALPAAAEKAGLANIVDFEFHEIDAWRAARELLNSGRIGGLDHIVVSWELETYSNRMMLDSWKSRSDEGGGTLNAFASHVFGYLEWFAGHISNICCELEKSPTDTRPGDTMNSISVDFASGASAKVRINTASPSGLGHRIEFRGNSGTMVLENTSRDHAKGFLLTLETGLPKTSETVYADNNVGPEDGRLKPVSRLAERFVEWIRTGILQEPSFKTGLRVQELLDASRESSRTSSRIECPVG